MRPIVGGLLVWIVPFVVSCFLIDPETGTKIVSYDVFRTTMVVVGSLTAAACTKASAPQTQREGMILAGVWLAVNWFLDAIILVPLLVVNDDAAEPRELNMENYLAMLPVWFARTGLGYITYVYNCVVVGSCVEQQRAQLAATGTPENKKQQ